MIYDIAVIGLGPAGSSFARLIDSKKYKVAAIDRKSLLHPEKHAKPCGGLLAPDAQRALARFGLSIPGDIIASPQIFSVKTIDFDNRLTNNYQRFYLNINRQKFDLWLMSLIPQSVDVFDDSVVTNIHEEDGTYSVEFRQAGERKRLTARHIVGAGGAMSIVTRQLFRNDMRRFRLCIQEVYDHHDQEPFFSCIFDSRNSDSYSWSLSKDGQFIFGGAYTIKGAAQAFERQKTQLIAMGLQFSEPTKRQACLVYKPGRLSDIRPGKSRIYLLGEAAGFISPSSYEGISGALDSAYILSRVFNSGTVNVLERYRRASFKLRLRYVVKIIKAGILCSKLLRRLIMKSRIRHINVISPPCPVQSNAGAVSLSQRPNEKNVLPE